MSLAVFICLVISLPLPSQAQTLDQAILNQLGNDCAGLGGTGASIAGLSTALNSICGIPVGSPGGNSVGGGTGSAQSLGATVQNRREAQLGSEGDHGKDQSNQGLSLKLGQGVGVFISANFEGLDRDVTTFADGFNSTVLGATLGGDFRFNDQAVAGAAFNFTNRDGNFDGGGTFSTNSYGVIFFGSFIPIPSFFIDLSVGYTGHNYLVARPVSFAELGTTVSIGGVASSNSSGDEASVRILAGHDHTYGNITVGPRIGLNYSNLNIDSYAESGGGGLALVYDEQQVHSLQSTIGVQGSMAVSTTYGIWVPQANAEFIHEFENNQRFINVRFLDDGRATPTKFSFQNDTPERNFFNLGLGTVLVLPNGIQPFADFRVMIGNDQFNNYAGTIGIRIEG